MHLSQDTKKILECGNEIISLAAEYKKIIDRFFIRINSGNSAWAGEDATRFFNTINKEKNQYLNFGECLLFYGQFLIETANDVDMAIISNKVEG